MSKDFDQAILDTLINDTDCDQRTACFQEMNRCDQKRLLDVAFDLEDDTARVVGDALTDLTRTDDMADERLVGNFLMLAQKVARGTASPADTFQFGQLVASHIYKVVTDRIDAVITDYTDPHFGSAPQRDREAA